MSVGQMNIFILLVKLIDVQVLLHLFRLKIRLKCNTVHTFIKRVRSPVYRPRWSSGYHTRLWIRGSLVRSRPGSMEFFRAKKTEYDFLRKGSKAVGSRVVDLRHLKEPQAEIRASEQKLSDFSRSRMRR